MYVKIPAVSSKSKYLSWLVFPMLLLVSAGCQRAAPLAQEKFLLDTVVTITSYDSSRLPSKEVRSAIEAGFDEIEAAEGRLNVYDSDSEVSRLNAQAGSGRPNKVSSELKQALSVSIQAQELTGGAFNPAIGPVTKAWRLEEKRVPPGRELSTAVALSDPAGLLWDEQNDQAALLTKGMRLDLGGVLKGVAVDRAAQRLTQLGLENTLLTTVSSSKALGPKPDGEPWVIGIRSPRPETTPGLVGTVELRRGSISTTGDYQQFFIKDGRRYHHVLDPAGGMPADGFMSVTVVTDKSGAFADALSTGLAVMGRKPAMRLVEGLPGVEVLFIDDSGKIWVSSGLKGKISDLVERVE
jgi:FAD:protein FMN transferase